MHTYNNNSVTHQYVRLTNLKKHIYQSKSVSGIICFMSGFV